MSIYRLSSTSLSKLEGVNPRLVDVVKRAIELTKVDFSVLEGKRSIARQKQLVASGASQTMKSKHIDGEAVDTAAYIGARLSWEGTLYDEIADAFAQAAREQGTKIRWGGAWHIDDIAAFKGTMEQATNAYVDLRRKEGKRPFLDYGHFELNGVSQVRQPDDPGAPTNPKQPSGSGWAAFINRLRAWLGLNTRKQ